MAARNAFVNFGRGPCAIWCMLIPFAWTLLTGLKEGQQGASKPSEWWLMSVGKVQPEVQCGFFSLSHKDDHNKDTGH